MLGEFHVSVLSIDRIYGLRSFLEEYVGGVSGLLGRLGGDEIGILQSGNARIDSLL